MIFATFLPRRLSQGGCVVAGTRFGSNFDRLKKELKDEKSKLSAKVTSAAQSLMAATLDVEALTTTDASMVLVDRGADRCVAAVQAILDGIERAFDYGQILPLSGEQTARLEDARTVRAALLPNGTGFLKLVYSQQWLVMSTMAKTMADKDVTAAIKRLGIEQEAARIQSWVTLYGNKLGVTEAQNADAAVVAVDAWHQAYGQLWVHAHSEYDDLKDDLHTRIRASLLSPYETQAEEERRAEQKARDKRKAESEGEGAAAPDKPKTP